MIETSTTIGAIAAALAAAQGEMSNAIRGSENPHFRSKYADLAAVRDACAPHLAAQKIAVIQSVTTADGAVCVSTMLAHASGEWLRWTASLKPDKPGAHALGSAVTYLRRYSLAAAVGIAQDDDDGNAASPEPRKRAAKDDGDVSNLALVLVARLTNPAPDGLGMTNAKALERIREKYKVSQIAEMTREQLEAGIKEAEAAIAERRVAK